MTISMALAPLVFAFDLVWLGGASVGSIGAVTMALKAGLPPQLFLFALMVPLLLLGSLAGFYWGARQSEAALREVFAGYPPLVA